MAMHLRCGKLFTGLEDDARSGQTVVVDGGAVAYVGATEKAPPATPADEVVDYADYFVMPGLIDAHTHLSFGNAVTEEDLDMYTPLEFRSLRALLNAQRVLAAGFIGVIDPGCSGRVMVAVRDAINAGMFAGPRIACSGPFIANHQGYTAFYPSWFNNQVAVCCIVDSASEAIEAIRSQIKDGVDFIKIAMDGRARNLKGELAAAFDQDTTKRMITECHRLGKKVIVHAKGAEAMLFGARAGADVIYHASWADEEALDAARENGCVICPSLTIIYNNNTFTQTTDASFNRTDHGASEWAAAHVSARRARELGIPLMAGSDSGFAINPCGEWHARELDLMVKHVGLTTAEVLRAATALNATFFDDAGRMGALEVGRHADILVVDGDPLADVAVLLDKSAIKEVYLEGEPVRLAVRPAQLAGETDNTYRLWQDMYDQRRVAELAAESRLRAI